MESEEYGEAERSILLETIQKTGYDEMSENQALAINLSFAGVMCSPTDVHTCYVSCTRVNLSN